MGMSCGFHVFFFWHPVYPEYMLGPWLLQTLDGLQGLLHLWATAWRLLCSLVYVFMYVFTIC